jgi:hypothetical protein
MTSDMVDFRTSSGRWEPLFRSTYRFSGAPPAQAQLAMAACLRAGPEAFAIGATAAAAWGLEGGRWTPPEIYSPRRISEGGRLIVVCRSSTYLPIDVTQIGPLPIATCSRTVVDLARTLDERCLEIALDQALRSGRVTLSNLAERVGALGDSRLAGLPLLRALIAERDPNAAIKPTELETLVLRWIKKFGFPKPIFQYQVELPDYGPSRLDFAYPDLLIGVEADSYAWHTGRKAFERDRIRLSEYASLGWIIVQITYREIQTYPDRPARRLERAIQQRVAS